jgi:hypothetical protein
MYFGTTTGYTLSRQATGDSTNLPNIQYCARIQRTNGTTGSNGGTIGQSIEIINSIPFAGKTVTLSFYARKGADYTGTSLSTLLKSGTGATDQNGIYNTYTGQANVISQTTTLTTTWQRFSYTGTVGSTATQLAVSFDSNSVSTSGANDYYDITGVQIDIGSVALPFRTYAATYQGELAACQRYYWRGTTTTSNFYGQGTVYSSTTASAILCPFPTQMRTVPSSVDYSNLKLTDPTTTYAVSAVSLDAAASTPRIGFLYCTNAIVVAYRPVLLGTSDSSAGYLGFNAEL